MTNKFLGALAYILYKVGGGLFNLGDWIKGKSKKPKAKKLFQKSYAAWSDDPDNEEKRTDYSLEKSEVVFDLGGYHGQWASDIFSKYGCCVHVFEPISCFTNKIKKRFYSNPCIVVHELGMAGESGEGEFILADDATSFERNQDGKKLKCQLISLTDFLKKYPLKEVALAKINIEGAEYDLLEDWIYAGQILLFRHLLIQFHEDAVDQAFDRMMEIQMKLRKTHYLEWSYPFVWESWKRKQ